MKLKNKTELLKELAENADNPADFIRYVMALQGQTSEKVVENIDMTLVHFEVTLSQLRRGQQIGPLVCCKIAKGLDIDPHILYTVVGNYAINKYLEKQAKSANNN